MKFNKDMKTSDLPIPNLGLLEIFLIQVLCYTLLWLFDNYAATLISIIFPVLFFFLLLVAGLAELIDRSKIPRWYFIFMILSILAPIITAIIFVTVVGADFDWSKLV